MEYPVIAVIQFVAWFLSLYLMEVKLARRIFASAGVGVFAAAILFLLKVMLPDMVYAMPVTMVFSNLGFMLFWGKITGYSYRYGWYSFLIAVAHGLLLLGADRIGRGVLIAGCLILLGAALVQQGQIQQPDWHEKDATGEQDDTWLPECINVILILVTLGYGCIHWPQKVAGWFVTALVLGMNLGCEAYVLLYLKERRGEAMAHVDASYRREMETFLNVIRSQRHDYNFHVRTLARVLKQGDLEACRTYVQELIEDSNAMNEVLPIKDPAISATIYNFRVLAAREGITLHIDLQNDLSHIVTNVYETNKIISNLLQNAIDEVKTHKDRSYGIWLYILKRGQYVMIHTANEVEQDVDPIFFEHMYQSGYTTKQGHDGVGLSSIQSLALRNHGVVYSRMEGRVLHIVAKLPLRYEASDEDTYERPIT